jgi:hypothetical protein
MGRVGILSFQSQADWELTVCWRTRAWQVSGHSAQPNCPEACQPRGLRSADVAEPVAGVVTFVP